MVTALVSPACPLQTAPSGFELVPTKTPCGGPALHFQPVHQCSSTEKTRHPSTAEPRIERELPKRPHMRCRSHHARSALSSIAVARLEGSERNRREPSARPVEVGSRHRLHKTKGELIRNGIWHRSVYHVLQVQTQYLLGFYYVYICVEITGFYKHLRHDPSLMSSCRFLGFLGFQSFFLGAVGFVFLIGRRCPMSSGGVELETWL
jgi:hypothetical protein